MAIQPLQLAYLHVMRASPLNVIAMATEHFKGPFIVNGGYGAESAEKAIVKHQAAAVSFATLFIANPDLVSRLRNSSGLAEVDQTTLYSAGREGYCDYPRSVPATDL